MNEDAVLTAPDLGLFAVADGSGREGAGQEASRAALEALSACFAEDEARQGEAGVFDAWGLPILARRLSRALHTAHAAVRALCALPPGDAGLSTTLAALALDPEGGVVHVAHVGHCRAYRMRDRHLEPLTHDHTVARRALETAPDEALAAPPHALTRALGMDGALRVDMRTLPLASGDRFLLCSDGLSGRLDDEQLAAALEQTMRPDALVRLLFEVAGAHRGQDNAAALVVDVDPNALASASPTKRPRIPPARPSAPLHSLRPEHSHWEEATWSDGHEDDDEPTEVDHDAYRP